MLRIVFGVLFLGLLSSGVAAPVPSGLQDLQWLIGDWKGTGEGDPGTSSSERHIASFLDGKYLRVDGRSVYEKQPKNPEGDIHGELGLWSYDRSRQTLVLREFDTLGFVSTYVLDAAASKPDHWVLVAESLVNVPQGWKARYLYTRVSSEEYQEVLELDPDGKGFKPYVTNRFRRVKN
jgi:hypothetical protein